ncbi:MAG: type II/IV secretion system protein [Rhodocyclaceae bacterium]|nr:type II/IV secretion system protein [Rhodocyclaceae bacterium]
MHAPAPPPRPLERILLDQGILSEDQWRIAQIEAARTKQPADRLLVALGFVSEATLCDALAESLGRPGVELREAVVDPAALRLVPKALAARHRLLPLDLDRRSGRLTVAAADADDLIAFDRLRAALPERLELDVRLAAASEIERAIDRHYGRELSIDGILREMATGEADPQAAPDGGRGQPAVRLVDAILVDAVKREASDVHFEPEAGFLRIRYRIDGLLVQVRALHASCWPAVAVRLKVVAGMDIAESRAAQDGRFGLTVGGRPIDFRASVHPTIHGESVVLRILDRQKGIVPLAGLGLADDRLAELRRMIARPEGLILVTGPTGSGKTTTLYSLLNHLRGETVNVMTLEDPVEYPMAQIRQTSVGEAARLDFADGVRSILRQDPDVILVGEIRDADTAGMALRAALTGHLVFATLHANSAAGAVPRLVDIGLPPDLLAGNVVGIVAQRLLRRLCPRCKAPEAVDDDARRRLDLAPDAAPPTIFRAAGCAACDFRGYRGRLAIMEILRVDADIDEMIARRAGSRELQRRARQAGGRTLADDGRRRVLDGSTSLAELARVVDLDVDKDAEARP